MESTALCKQHCRFPFRCLPTSSKAGITALFACISQVWLEHFHSFSCFRLRITEEVPRALKLKGALGIF